MNHSIYSADSRDPPEGGELPSSPEFWWLVSVSSRCATTRMKD